jgi:hypothetical protein
MLCNLCGYHLLIYNSNHTCVQTKKKNMRHRERYIFKTDNARLFGIFVMEYNFVNIHYYINMTVIQ